MRQGILKLISFQVGRRDKEEVEAVLFNQDKSVISRHLCSIYSTGELDKGATASRNATVQTEGNRKVTINIEWYNLDAIISVILQNRFLKNLTLSTVHSGML